MSENNNIKKSKDIESNKDIAAFSYTLIFAPILLVTRRDSEFILFHSRQALILFIFAVVFWTIGDSVRYLNIFVLVGSAIGFLHAMNGKMYKMPFVYDLSKQGFTPSGIWRILKSGSLFLYRVFRGMVPQKIAEKLPISKSGEDHLRERVENLEQIVFLEKYFFKNLKNSDISLSLELKKQYEDFQKEILLFDKNTKKEVLENNIYFSGKFGKIFLGMSSKDSFFVGFYQSSFSNIKADVSLGKFSGIYVSEEKPLKLF